MKFTLLEKYILDERYALCEDATELNNIKNDLAKLTDAYEVAVKPITDLGSVSKKSYYQLVAEFFTDEAKEAAKTNKALEKPEKLTKQINKLAEDTVAAYYDKGWVGRYQAKTKKAIPLKDFNAVLQAEGLFSEFETARNKLGTKQNWDTFKAFFKIINKCKRALDKYMNLDNIDNKALQDAKQSIKEVDEVLARTVQVLNESNAEADTTMQATVKEAIEEANKKLSDIPDIVNKITPDFLNPETAHDINIPSYVADFTKIDNEIKAKFEPLTVADNEDTRTDWATQFEQAAKEDATGPRPKQGEKSKVGQLWDKYFTEYLCKQSNDLNIDLLYSISDPLIKEIRAFGFTTTTNPFLVYLTKNAKLIESNPTVYYNIHDSYLANSIRGRKISANDLEGNGTLKDQNLIFNKLLFSSAVNAQTYIDLQAKAISLFKSTKLSSDVEGEDPAAKYNNKPIDFFHDLFFVGGNILDSKINKPDLNILKSPAAITEMMTTAFGKAAIDAYDSDEAEGKKIKLTDKNYKKAAETIVEDTFKNDSHNFESSIAKLISAIASAQVDGNGIDYIKKIKTWSNAKLFDKFGGINHIPSEIDQKDAIKANTAASKYDFTDMLKAGLEHKDLCDKFIQALLDAFATKKASLKA